MESRGFAESPDSGTGSHVPSPWRQSRVRWRGPWVRTLGSRRQQTKGGTSPARRVRPDEIVAEMPHCRVHVPTPKDESYRGATRNPDGGSRAYR